MRANVIKKFGSSLIVTCDCTDEMDIVLVFIFSFTARFAEILSAILKRIQYCLSLKFNIFSSDQNISFKCGIFFKMFYFNTNQQIKKFVPTSMVYR